MIPVESFKERLIYPTVFGSFDNPCLNCLKVPTGCKDYDKIDCLIRVYDEPYVPVLSYEMILEELDDYFQLYRNTYDSTDKRLMFANTADYKYRDYEDKPGPLDANVEKAFEVKMSAYYDELLIVSKKYYLYSKALNYMKGSWFHFLIRNL